MESYKIRTTAATLMGCYYKLTLDAEKKNKIFIFIIDNKIILVTFVGAKCTILCS